MKIKGIVVMAAAFAACNSSKSAPSGSASVTKSGGSAASSAADTKAPSGASADLTGAGSTFAFPLYSKWSAEYEKVKPGVKINYQSIGSGGGIKMITEKTADFGATDAPMSDEELAKASGKILHIPTAAGAVVLAYNVPKAANLKLTPDLVAGIFLGTIKKWNDPKLVAANPDLKLPGDDILVAYRSDGSGTTAAFTDYLSKISPDWKTKVGAGKSVKFPTGMGAKGNEGVAGQIKGAAGTIGYVELAYAKQTGLDVAWIQNSAGKFIEPTLDSTSAAAAGATIPDDFRVSITNAAGDAAYPISTFTWVLVYQDASGDAGKAKALADFLWWGIHDGQKLGGALFYAPLPAALVTREEAVLKTLTAGGKALNPGT
jgi:phosphate transport system substrate-binding protein